MTIQELFERCDLQILSASLLQKCEAFSCGDSEDEQDLNEFFAQDAIPFQNRLLGKTYILTHKQTQKEKELGLLAQIVSFFTLSNDSIRLTNKFAEEYKGIFLEETDLRDKTIKRFPGVLLGRLGTNKKFASQGYGSAVMNFIKYTFTTNNRTGCRFIIVDALNNDRTINYYQRNGFQFLIDDERLEAKYIGIGVGHLPLNTRLMYFDLLKLKVEEE